MANTRLRKSVLEVRTADLLFHLPDELNVERHRMLDGIPSGEERGQRRSFVVGRAAAVIPIVLDGKLERVAGPFGFHRRLHIKMVIDGHRRPVGMVFPAGHDHRMPAGLDDGGEGAERLQRLGDDGRARPHIVAACRVHTDRRHLDPSAQPRLEPQPALFDICVETVVETHNSSCTVS